MKHQNIRWGVILVSAIIALWVLFGILPFLTPKISETTILLWGVSFSAATALFTGVAFAVAYRSLYNQQESLRKQQEYLEKQIDLSVFSVFLDSMRSVTNSKSFREYQDYILSDEFYNDLEYVRSQLHRKKDDDIYLDDYDMVINQSKDDMTTSKRLRYNVYKIQTYCMRMEFIGTIVLNLKEKTAEQLLIQTYGDTIKKTYKRVRSLIANQSASLYKNYAQLNEIATQNNR